MVKQPDVARLLLQAAECKARASPEENRWYHECTLRPINIGRCAFLVGEKGEAGFQQTCS